MRIKIFIEHSEGVSKFVRNAAVKNEALAESDLMGLIDKFFVGRIREEATQKKELVYYGATTGRYTPGDTNG